MNAPVKNFSEMQRAARALRRTGPTAIEHSGGTQTIFGCICGSRHTASTDWDGRNAKHVKEWQGKHKVSCRGRWQRIVARRDAAWLDAQRDSVYSRDN